MGRLPRLLIALAAALALAPAANAGASTIYALSDTNSTLPPDQIERMLSASEAAELAKRFERDAPKKAPTTRIRRKPRRNAEAGK